VVAIVMIGKSLAAFLIVAVFHYPLRTELTISASLAQIGEFSFILAALALSLGLLPREGQNLIVAAAIISIALQPVSFWFTDRIAEWIERYPKLRARLERAVAQVPEVAVSEHEGLHDHAIIVGYGHVGSAIGEILVRSGVPFVAIDDHRDRVVAQRERGQAMVYGDATRPSVLEQAHPEHARLLVAATPDPFKAGAIIERARAANPSIKCVARAHSNEAQRYLEEHGADVVVIGERELAFGLAYEALVHLGREIDVADRVVDEFRRAPPEMPAHA
jgi:CPA2 family monovalent cation:H+ antiporter-2